MSIYESCLRSGTIYFAFTIIGCSILLYIVPGNTPSRSRLKNNLTSSFDTLSSILIGIHDTDGAFLRGSDSTIKRVAILRPLHMQASVIDSFLLWKKFLPCELTKENKPKVDIFLSATQSFDTDSDLRRSSESLLSVFKAKEGNNCEINGGDHCWMQCIDNIYLIEANIPPTEDVYKKNEAAKNIMWVNGPNRHFSTSMDTIGSGNYGDYDAVFVMEVDTVPVKQHWLDKLVDEAEQEDFAILGSKFKGDAWDPFWSSLPLSLQHHINGNALYNLKHPLTHLLLSQLKEEADTPFNAVSYDYRISQILVEGMLGIRPELPPGIAKEWQKERGLEVPSYKKRFRKWEHQLGEDYFDAIRQSTVIANYAMSNILTSHLENETYSIIHGARIFKPWDRTKYDITVVVSVLDGNLPLHFLSAIRETLQPSEIIVMYPQKVFSDDFEINKISSMLNQDSKLKIKFQKRTSNVSDICSASVQTRWFIIADANSMVAEKADLFFTNDKNLKPVIPFLKSDGKDCLENKECVIFHKSLNNINLNSTMFVRDSDMLFNSQARNKFCAVTQGKEREPLSPTTASSYVSYLNSYNQQAKLYEFSDETQFRSRSIFVKSSYQHTSVAKKNKKRGLLNLQQIGQGFSPSAAPPPCVDDLEVIIFNRSGKRKKKRNKSCAHLSKYLSKNPSKKNKMCIKSWARKRCSKTCDYCFSISA